MSADGSGKADRKCENPCQGKGLVADRRQLAAGVKAEGMGFEPTTPCGAPDFESAAIATQLFAELQLAA